MWKTQAEKGNLENEDALNRARWRVGVGEIAVRVLPTPFTGINPDQNWID